MSTAGVPVASAPERNTTRNGSASSFCMTRSSTVPSKAPARSVPRVPRKALQLEEKPWPRGSASAFSSQALSRVAFQTAAGACTSIQTAGAGASSPAASDWAEASAAVRAVQPLRARSASAVPTAAAITTAAAPAAAKSLVVRVIGSTP